MKIKTMFKYLVSAVFASILFLLLQQLLMPKYAEEIPEGNFTAEYYQETAGHDVIMVGDCEVYENINPMYLWKNFGITSYIRGNAQQLVWQSYYMLEDTLRYETPKAVVYNVQALQYASPQKEEYNRMTLDNMKWSESKWNAIQASMLGDETMVDYLFPLFRYHDRIFELQKQDFKYFFKRKKSAHNGYYVRVDVLPASQSDVADSSWLFEEKETKQDAIIDPWADIQTEEEDEKKEERKKPEAEENQKFGEVPMEYLEKMRLLCEENQIALILIKAPSLAPQWYQWENEQITEYAEKHQIEYINFYSLIDELGIDYETDTYDGGLHMNLNGADKLSEYLGQLLQKEYEIPDHRDEKELMELYNEKYLYFQQEIKKQEEQIKIYGKVLD